MHNVDGQMPKSYKPQDTFTEANVIKDTFHLERFPDNIWDKWDSYTDFLSFLDTKGANFKPNAQYLDRVLTEINERPSMKLEDFDALDKTLEKIQTIIEKKRLPAEPLPTIPEEDEDLP